MLTVVINVNDISKLVRKRRERVGGGGKGGGREVRFWGPIVARAIIINSTRFCWRYRSPVASSLFLQNKKKLLPTVPVIFKQKLAGNSPLCPSLDTLQSFS